MDRWQFSIDIERKIIYYYKLIEYISKIKPTPSTQKPYIDLRKNGIIPTKQLRSRFRVFDSVSRIQRAI